MSGASRHSRKRATARQSSATGSWTPVTRRRVLRSSCRIRSSRASSAESGARSATGTPTILGDAEDLPEVGLDLVLGALLGEAELLDQQGAGGVEHLPLAEGQVFVALEEVQVAEHLGDLEHGTGLDLLHVLPVPAVPGGGVDRDVLLPEDGVDLLDVVLADDLPQADRADLVDGDHDPHPVFQDSEDVERLALARDLGVLDAHHLAHTLARIHGLVARLEAGLHLGAASFAASKTAKSRELTTDLVFPQRVVLTLPLGTD